MSDMTGPLQAPFPHFGGKSRVAAEIWARFGNPENYVEPFAGKLAVLLARPDAPKVETVNDKCRFISNFWRSVKSDPAAVAKHADWPVNEADLEARHYWLVTEGAKRLERILGDPDGYDALVAAWWVWGVCAWIGSGWCFGDGPWQWSGDAWTKGDAGQGVHRKLPHLSDAGQGVHRKRPHLGDAGQGVREWMVALSVRLRSVRVCCGEWDRVLGDSVTVKNGLTAVLLDPPYANDLRVSGIYAQDCGSVAAHARDWAIANGRRKDLRIALCGYDGEHGMPEDWSKHRWKTKGGYGCQGDGRGRENSSREVVWFSPHCLAAPHPTLFDIPVQGSLVGDAALLLGNGA